MTVWRGKRPLPVLLVAILTGASAVNRVVVILRDSGGSPLAPKEAGGSDRPAGGNGGGNEGGSGGGSGVGNGGGAGAGGFGGAAVHRYAQGARLQSTGQPQAPPGKQKGYPSHQQGHQSQVLLFHCGMLCTAPSLPRVDKPCSFVTRKLAGTAILI